MFYVDLPRINDSMENVGEFDTKAEALEFIRKNIAHCDDEGNISILSEMDDDDSFDEDEEDDWEVCDDEDEEFQADPFYENEEDDPNSNRP